MSSLLPLLDVAFTLHNFLKNGHLTEGEEVPDARVYQPGAAVSFCVRACGRVGSLFSFCNFSESLGEAQAVGG